MGYKVEFQPFIPEGFEGEPVDEADALKRARAVLAEEGRWMRGDWFQNLHPDVDPEDAFCNNWRVCAEGAVLMVTVGATRGGSSPSRTWTYRLPWSTARRRRALQVRLYGSSLKLLVKAGLARWPNYARYRDSIEANTFNDSGQCCSTRTDVLWWFDDAIALAEGKQAATV